MAWTLNPFTGALDFYENGVTDHGALTGLADDDHTQYALLAGRAGGQVLIGGTGTTDDLTFQTTAGVGTTGADFIWKGGNNGATELARLLNSGNLALTGGQVAFTPTNIISLSGEAAQTIWMERELTAATAGRNLTVQAGGAVSGASNRAGGNLILSGGISTGTQGSQVQIWTAAGAGSGTTDRTPSVKLNVAGTGAQTWTQTLSAGGNATTQNLTTTSLNSNSVIGNAWSHTHTNMIDAQAFGLQLGLNATIDALDAGGSTVQGFAFEIFAATEDAGSNWAGAAALGGFIQHSGPGTMSSATIMSAQMNTLTGAGLLGTYTGYFVNINILSSNITTYRGLHISGVGSYIGGTVSEARGIDIEDLSSHVTTTYAIYSQGGQSVHAGNLRIGSTSAPTAKLHLDAGTATAGTAPIIFTSGTSLTSAVAGAMEFTTDDLFFTITTGTARKRLLMADPTGGLTSGRIPFATTNGRLTDDADLTFATDTLTVTKIAATTLTGNLTITDAINVVLGTTTGTKIGTATTQLLGFWNAAPVAQYATTGTVTGHTGGGGTAVTHSDTFTGNTGATAYTIGDIVRALKLSGIIAA